MEGLEVQTVPADWGVPSLSAHANAALAYVRLSGNQSRIKATPRTNVLSLKPTASLIDMSWRGLKCDLEPHLVASGASSRDGGEDGDGRQRVLATGLMAVVEELRAKNCNLEEGLSDAQQADILAYTTMIEHALAPALAQFLWLDGTNGSATSRPAMAQHLTFPIPLFAPSQCVEDAKQMTQGRTQAEVYGSATSCFSALEQRLGNKEFLFGNRATMADCLAFGYLTIFLNAPMPNASLAVSLDTCPRLVHWCRQLEQLHFSREHRDYRSRLRRKAEEEKGAAKQRWRIGLSVAAAAAVMVSYSVIMAKVPQNIVFLLS